MIDVIFYMSIIFVAIISIFIIIKVLIKSLLFLLRKKVKVIGEEVKSRASDISNEINKLK